MAVAADDIGIASAVEHIHHCHRDASWLILVALPVVAFAVSTASAAVVVVAAAAAAAASELSASVA